MWYRQSHKEWEASSSDGRKAAMHSLVDDHAEPGLLAYDDERPVGWISLAPRPEFKRLLHSRVARPLDDRPVWSVVCFYVDKDYRRRGVTVALLQAGIEFARQHGASIVEGYPVEPEEAKPDPWVYVGLASAFRKAGFEEAGRHTEKRPIMRYYLEAK